MANRHTVNVMGRGVKQRASPVVYSRHDEPESELFRIQRMRAVVEVLERRRMRARCVG